MPAEEKVESKSITLVFFQIDFSISKMHSQCKSAAKVAPLLQTQTIQTPLLQLGVTTAVAEQACVCLSVWRASKKKAGDTTF